MANPTRVHIDLGVPDGLVRMEASTCPVISVYADWAASGRGLHEAPTTVRKELHEASRFIPQRGSSRVSFDADVERILAYLAEEAPRDVSGLALFACAGEGLWHPTTLAVHVPTRAHVGERPMLVPLAEATQDTAPVLVALGDTTELRLIVLDHPRLREIDRRREQTWGGARSTSKTGWRRGHLQRAYETELARFAHHASDAIAEAARAGGIPRLAVAGDAVFVPALLGALPPRVRALVLAEAHLDIDATLDEIAGVVWPVVRERAAAERVREAAQIVVRAEGRIEAVSAPEEVREMVTAGRVHTLVIDAAVLDPAAAELLLREALAHGSRVLIVRDDASIGAIGGIAATLR